MKGNTHLYCCWLLSMSENADLLGFHCTTIFTFTESCLKKERIQWAALFHWSVNECESAKVWKKVLNKSLSKIEKCCGGQRKWNRKVTVTTLASCYNKLRQKSMKKFVLFRLKSCYVWAVKYQMIIMGLNETKILILDLQWGMSGSAVPWSHLVSWFRPTCHMIPYKVVLLQINISILMWLVIFRTAVPSSVGPLDSVVFVVSFSIVYIYIGVTQYGQITD